MKCICQPKECAQKGVQPTEVISEIPAALYGLIGTEEQHGQPQEEGSKGEREVREAGGGVLVVGWWSFELQNDSYDRQIPQHCDQCAQGTGQIKGQVDPKDVVGSIAGAIHLIAQDDEHSLLSTGALG